MTIKPITPEEISQFNAVISHPLQTYEWGEFRKKTRVTVIRRGIFTKEKLTNGFQLTIHKLPKMPWTIGYLPKGEYPTKEIIEALQQIGKQEKCIFIQLEPNISISQMTKSKWQIANVHPAAHPLFTKYTFVLDLTKSEGELLRNMHSKARYNIKVAKKHGVKIVEDNSDKAFHEYLRLTKETTSRQKFYAHTETYHRKQWQTLSHTIKKNTLSSHLFVAKYKGKILTAWMLFVFNDTLYYPYGASSSQHREVMSSNLMMWEAIRFGKKLGLKKFDMWGALDKNPDKSDPWYGFHSFKEKYGPKHVEFIGSFDLVINPILYQGYKLINKLRWAILKLKK
jgi:lipid II:glycine glycyltransferase (peptidoglycan interpeptide bridge formation enzyme)